MPLRSVFLLLCALPGAFAQTPDQVLVVVNKQSITSRAVGEYYVHRRQIPAANLCTIDTPPDETIGRAAYTSGIETPIGKFLTRHNLREKILYIVLTTGVPLRIEGNQDAKLEDPGASVDSELTLLYQRLHGAVDIPLAGPIANPFYRQRDVPFRHPTFAMYLVTRLDGYNMKDMQALVDRAFEARNSGKFVIDARADNNTQGNQWLRTAALLLPKERVVMDDSAKVLENLKDVIGYASWGSNDPDRRRRRLHFEWLPGAIATEFVSTDARSFRPPAETWELGSWGDTRSWFVGSPQTLTADYIHEGATGASGQAWEPYLQFCPRPDIILPAYFSGRNLAESFYMGIPGLSWMNVVIGDPLARLQ